MPSTVGGGDDVAAGDPAGGVVMLFSLAILADDVVFGSNVECQRWTSAQETGFDFVIFDVLALPIYWMILWILSVHKGPYRTVLAAKAVWKTEAEPVPVM